MTCSKIKAALLIYEKQFSFILFGNLYVRVAEPFQKNLPTEFKTFSFQGCTVGYCAKVCPTGAYTVDNRFVGFTGNKGPAGTGSNGNAGPLNAAGVAVDPAAVSLLKQQQEYFKWARWVIG